MSSGLSDNLIFETSRMAKPHLPISLLGGFHSKATGIDDCGSDW